MVITREIRDEIRNSVSTSINSVLKEEAFIKLIVEKVSDSLTKTLGEKIGELEQKINETNKKCVENSTVIEELKEGTAVLKSEDEYLLRKSLFTGFQEFKEIVLENDIDIMLLSETWLGPDDHSVVVDIPGYTLFRKNRVGRGGGVGAYVKVSVQAFADDTQMYLSFSTEDWVNVEDIINNELNNIKTSSDQHNLKLNSEKSKILYLAIKTIETY
ncbi:hypothetical protein JTB14_016413 [Gonioctena quinquepunctata]|nr:hypothetical protein JTB14_016413 [Gonioctena quinquepunctata]